MKKFFFTAVSLLGFASFASSQTTLEWLASAPAESECYFYEAKDNDSKFRIIVLMKKNQDAFSAIIYREVDHEKGDRISQKIDLEGNLSEGKFFYMNQKPVTIDTDASTASTDNEEQVLKVVDKNKIIVDGKTLVKGNCSADKD